MKILYRDSSGKPSNGDVKVLRSGRKFLRQQQRHNGMFVVSSGRPVYEWYCYDGDTVSDLRRRLESGKFTVAEVLPSRRKGRSIHIKFHQRTTLTECEQGQVDNIT